MTILEMKTAIEELTPEERVHLEAWLKARNMTSSTAYREEMSRRLCDVTAGRHVNADGVREFARAFD